MEYYPPWLGGSLVADAFPWEEATRTTLPAFVAAYTLHDSYWLGWYARPNREAIAILRFDTWHTGGVVPFPGSVVAHWPLLLVRVERLYQLHMDYGSSPAYDAVLVGTIAAARSATIPGAEREALLDAALRQPGDQDALSAYLLEDPLYRTVFQSVGAGQVQAIHGGATDVLCLSREGDVLRLPGLTIARGLRYRSDIANCRCSTRRKTV
jgi:hypothetical protein